MPSRMRASTSLNANSFKPGEPIELQGTAENLYGTPAANRKYEVELQLQSQEIQPPELKDYNFSLSKRPQDYFDNKFKEGRTGEDGAFSVSFTIANNLKNHGLLVGKLFTTVFDETGRPIYKLNTVPVSTQPYYLGIQQTDRYIGTNQPLSVPIVATDANGKIVSNVKAQVQLVRLEWQNVLERNYQGSLRYVSRYKEIEVNTKQITVTGTSTRFTAIPSGSGRYEVRVSLPGAQPYVAASYYAYRFGSTNYSSFEIDKEGKILVETNKEQYRPGETASVLIKAPFAGKLLVTVERDEVLEEFIVNAPDKSVKLDIPIRENYLPNAYITATMLKPLTDPELPLTVATGVAPVFVEKASSRMQLAIEAPQKVRSNTQQEVTVKTGLSEKDIEVTVAVVDEGILLVKDYKTPDIHGFFYQQRALEVDTYNLYPRLFPELKPMTRSFGSDAYALAGRLNPLANRRVKLIAYWSGTLRTDKRGEVSYTFEVPEYNGELRVMAVAAKGSTFGSAEKAITVADPVIVTTALPRFFSPADKASVPVTLTNTTNQSIEAEVKASTSSNLAVAANAVQQVTLPPNKEVVVLFDLEVAKQIGQGRVQVEVKAGADTFKNDIEIPIRPPSSLLKASGSGSIAAGSSATIDLQQDYLQSSVKGKLVVSKNPAVGLGKYLDALIQYPYGCVEQTTSAAFPQLYLKDLQEALGDKVAAISPASSNVQFALRKLNTMQLYNGALSYWPGSTSESWWGTAYAAHFMQEARKAGFDIDEDILSRMYSYLQRQVKEKKKREQRFYNAQNQLFVREIAPREIFYSLYVLANDGQRDIGTMNYYRQNKELLTPDAKYLLALTYLLSGKDKEYRELLPKSFGQQKAVQQTGGSFSSYIRDQALVLNALLETDPSNAQVPELARNVSSQMASTRYLNTQELAFGTLALGKLAKAANQQSPQASVQVQGAELATYTGGSNSLVLTNAVAGQQVKITTSGSGDIYYFWEAQGLSSTGNYPEEDKGLKVRRSYLNRFGQAITGSVKQNDLMYVKIELESDGRSIENVVVTDILPAGFEVENPRNPTMPISAMTGSTSLPPLPHAPKPSTTRYAQ